MITIIVFAVLIGWGLLLALSALFGTLVSGVMEKPADKDQDDWSWTRR